MIWVWSNWSKFAFCGLLGISETGVHLPQAIAQANHVKAQRSHCETSIFFQSPGYLQTETLKKALRELDTRWWIEKTPFFSNKVLHLPNCVCPLRTTSAPLCLNNLFGTVAADSELSLPTCTVACWSLKSFDLFKAIPLPLEKVHVSAVKMYPVLLTVSEKCCSW